MSEEIAWEHKQWNVELAASVAADILPEEHKPQVYQVLMVTGAKVLIFTVSDGTDINRVSMKIYPDEAWFERIRAGWAQFNKDLEMYEPVVVTELPAAEPIESLPAVTVQVRGELTMSNLREVTPLFDKFLSGLVKEYKTDKDFVTAKAQAKQGRDGAKQCRLTAKAIVDQMQSVAEATRTLELYADKFDAAALEQEKAVEQQEKLRKAEAKLQREQAYTTHIKALDDEIAPLRLVLADVDKPNFIEVMKNQRSLSSLYNKLDTELARVKIAADSAASAIRAKRTWYLEAAKGYEHLFADLQALINRGDMEFFQLAVNNRVNDHKAAEEKRLEEERARIAAEEKVKAETAAAETLRQEREAMEARTQAMPGAAQEHRTAEPVIPGQTSLLSPVAPSAASVRVPARTAGPVAKVNIGTINEKLGFIVNAEFLSTLGFTSQPNDKNIGKFYPESDLPRIFEAIARHTLALASQQLKAAA
jgi:hypothetical protein